MKKINLLLIILLLTKSLTAQVYKTLNVSTAGTLTTLLTTSEKSTITNLTLTGKIDSRDFSCIHDEIKSLTSLDISTVSIQAYGTNLANELPSNSFYDITFFNIELPKTLTSIGDAAFKYCLGLYNITIPNSVTKIGNNAFYHCTTLRNITISSSLTTIGTAAFYECSNLTSITIPKSVTLIGNHAFAFCSGLINVEVGNLNYSSLNGILFNKNQTKLIKCPTSITGNYIIPNTVDSIETNAFLHCTLLTSVSNSSSIINIGGAAFSGCTSLTSVTFPNTLISIGSNCFELCSSLATINLPYSVSSIGNSVFYGCSNLKTLYSYNPIPPTTGSLLSIASKCTLYVPTGSKSLYASTTNWKDFINIIEITTSLQPLKQSNIKIKTENKNIIINNATIGNMIKIYNINGKKIKEQLIDCDQIKINLEQGVFLISIGNYSDKVIIN